MIYLSVCPLLSQDHCYRDTTFCSFPLWIRLECPCDFSVQELQCPSNQFSLYLLGKEQLVYLGINIKEDKNSNSVFAIPKKPVTFAFQRAAEAESVWICFWMFGMRARWDWLCLQRDGLWYECRVIHCLWWIAFPLAVSVFSTISS